MRDLAVLIPTRGRPGNVRKVVSAWDFTNAWDHADMVLVVDQDDPEIGGYRALESDLRNPDTGEPLIKLYEVRAWVPMVHKLNQAAAALAPGWFALGFAGDDHLPQTIGWAARYLTVLRELGTGMVYGDDGYQGKKLSTEWAVTSDAVRALGRMVPADVEHMYCDNAMMDLFGGAGAMRHLPEIRIEHMHPIVGKAETDEQYQRVNHRDQFKKDRLAYMVWREGQTFTMQTAAVRNLRKGRPDVTTEPTPVTRPRVAGSAPRKVVQRSGPSAARGPRLARVPRHFRQVRAATPEDVMVALADFATQVPADQEIVELGVFQGRTALQLAWGASLGNGAHVTGIDPWDLPGNVYDPPFTDAESRSWARHWVDSLGYADKICLIQTFSQKAAEEWPIDHPDKKVGLLFVDGDHTKEGAKRDIVSWSPHLAEGARIAIDDYIHPDWPGVAQAVDELVDEGFLEPVQVFHDRLAVTRLTDVIERTDPAPVTAITSEGVSPSPYPAAPGQVAEPIVVPHSGELKVAVRIKDVELPEREVLEAEWRRVDPEGVASLERSAAALDTNVSRSRDRVSHGELQGVAAHIRIEELTLPQLRALAKARGVVLGIRKDKKADTIQALKDGK